MSFEVFVIIHIVNLTIVWVFPNIEINGLVLNIILFSVFANGTLFVLKEEFMVTRLFHITILKSSLIRSPSSVCGCYFVVEPRWEVVHLYVEMTHAVHKVALFWVWCF